MLLTLLTVSTGQSHARANGHPRTPHPRKPSSTRDREAACSARSTLPSDAALCSDFYTESAGVAFTMLPFGAWIGSEGFRAHPGGEDRAIFLDAPPFELTEGRLQQALSIVHSGLSTSLFQLYCDLGLVFRVASGGFYRYFQACPQGTLNRQSSDPRSLQLQASCGDGTGCAAGRCSSLEDAKRAAEVQRQRGQGDAPIAGCPPGFRTVAATNATISEFTAAKNAIVRMTGRSLPPPDGCAGFGSVQAGSYNEFDVYGLDPMALAGILWHPSESCSAFHPVGRERACKPSGGHSANCSQLSRETVCAFMARFDQTHPRATARRAGKTWPVYSYRRIANAAMGAGSDLVLEFYLDETQCSEKKGGTRAPPQRHAGV